MATLKKKLLWLWANVNGGLLLASGVRTMATLLFFVLF
jgi:hypothetical protein